MADGPEARAIHGVDGAPLCFLALDGSLEAIPDDTALSQALVAGQGALWVHIESRSESQWRLLSDLFHFHPLAIEDTRSPETRSKLEDYEGFLFVVVREAHWDRNTPEPYDFRAPNLYLFIGGHFVVSVADQPCSAVQTVRERLSVAPDLLARGADHLAYVLIDTVVDHYFPLLDEIDDLVEALEEGILAERGGRIMGDVFDLKRTVLALRRHLAPMREVAGTLANRPSPQLRPETQVYFRDVHDHVLRQVEAVENYRDMLTSALEIHFSVVSNRMNEVIKALSVIATVVLPPTLVASIYGMNFDFMPGLHSAQGFWIAVGLMVLISGGFVGYLSWKGWL